jgi:hippurate hydrolase
MLQEKVKALAAKYADENIATRHHIHSNPELSYLEFETCLFVQNRLQEIGIPYTVMATTGVVGILEGKNPTSRIIALRADLDALPIVEQNDIPYKSKKDGIMHGCGHDVHTTCLLGAAKILFELKDEWEGTIKLIFQPGEEKNPGGASILIKEGVLENPKPEAIVGMHVNPQLQVGKLSYRSGMVMASADELYITLKGKGGHAAAPHFTHDTLLAASHITIGLQHIISRNNNPFNPSLITITSIQGGNTTNVIPSEVKMMGTLRCMNEEWRTKAHELIKKYVTETATTMGIIAEVHIDIGYPFVLNNAAVTENARAAAKQFINPELVEETELRMGAEDFGYYSHQIPGTFFRLGTMNAAKGITSGVHTPTFNIDEAAIELGVGIMAWMGITLRKG